MIRYYNKRHIPIPVFYFSNKIFLNLLNIYIIYLSTKLLHHYLKLYIVEKQVKPILYYLKFSPVLRRLHPVFSIVNLIAVPNSLILERYSSLFKLCYYQ